MRRRDWYFGLVGLGGLAALGGLFVLVSGVTGYLGKLDEIGRLGANVTPDDLTAATRLLVIAMAVGLPMLALGAIAFALGAGYISRDRRLERDAIEEEELAPRPGRLEEAS